MRVAVHYAEIALKGRNRPRFEHQLLSNLTRALRELGEVRTRRLFGRLLLELPDAIAFDEAARRIGRVFGVAHFGRALVCEPTPADIARTVERALAGAAFASFGVRARRADKTLPFRSRELEREIGSQIGARSGARVDLESPELWVEIDVLSREAIVRCERLRGPGGMPVGSAGNAVALLSGGIDSPVAAWLAMKRGCRVVFVHFHSSPYTSAASQDKVRDLVRLLALWNGPSQLHLVPFGEAQQALLREAPAEPRVVLYRRLMLRIAERIAGRERARALIAGDSIGQVASQTLGNLDTINRAATLPVLRPLIGMDKAEIVAKAREIGSFEISIEPEEDCCSYLLPRRPATWTQAEEIEAIEEKLELGGMIETALSGTELERIESSGSRR